jgi:thiamine pyridinylase
VQERQDRESLALKRLRPAQSRFLSGHRKNWPALSVFSVALVALALACSTEARAGSLLLENSGPAAVVCQPAGSGLPVPVPAGGSATLQPPPGSTIEDLSCGSLSFGQLDLYTSSGDRLLFLNGKQTRTLRSALFPYIPTPGGNFDPLVKMIATGFQALHPDIALEIVISQDVDPYNYSSFPTIFGPGGFDTVEIDTSLLSTLVGGRYIVAMPQIGEAPLPFAARAVQAPAPGTVYGIPTWICRDFFYSYDRGATGVTSLPLLLNYLDSRPSAIPRIAAIFNGPWTLLSLYLNAVVSTYGYTPQAINYALTQPVDSKVIDGLAEIAHACTTAGTNAIPCIDDTYKKMPDGDMERLFANASVSTDVGYSERSFFMLQTQPTAPYLVQMPYGPKPVPMMFVDALVRSVARCANDPCATDANAFALYMSRASVRSAISFTDDVPGSPARHLLPANASFYSMPRVRADRIYSQIIPLLGSMQYSPTTITQPVLNDVSSRVCAALKLRLPQYVCPS